MYFISSKSCDVNWVFTDDDDDGGDEKKKEKFVKNIITTHTHTQTYITYTDTDTIIIIVKFREKKNIHYIFIDKMIRFFRFFFFRKFFHFDNISVLLQILLAIIIVVDFFVFDDSIRCLNDE